MPPFIVESQATGAEIEVIIAERLLPAIHDLERRKVLIALLTLMLTIMKPDISAEEVVDGVKSVSQYICMFLSESDSQSSEGTEKKLLN